MRSRAPLRALLGAGLLALCAAACAAPADLLAYWPMDSAPAGVVADASGRGHDATYSAADDATATFVPGMLGQALNLTAAQEGYLTVAHSEDFNFSGPFTVMAWVKPAERAASYEVLCFKGDRSGNPPWPGWRLRLGSARAWFEVGTPDGQEVRLNSPEWSVPVGYWTHVAATWDGKKLRIMVNATEATSAGFTGSIAPRTDRRPLTIANYHGRKNAYPYQGLLDEVKVFTRALTEDEVFAEAKR
jgi:hypothetical protein